MVLEQATGQLATVPGEQIDQTLLELAKMLLGARSIDARPAVVLYIEPMSADGVVDAEPQHNED